MGTENLLWLMKNEKQVLVISNGISEINTQNFQLRNMYVPEKQR